MTTVQLLVIYTTRAMWSIEPKESYSVCTFLLWVALHAISTARLVGALVMQVGRSCAGLSLGFQKTSHEMKSQKAPLHTRSPPPPQKALGFARVLTLLHPHETLYEYN